MKKFLLVTLLFMGCMGGNSSNPSPLSYYNYATQWNWSQYDNKEIDHIKYVENGEMSGDVILIFFKDGTTLRIYAYKYTMKVRNGGLGNN